VEVNIQNDVASRMPSIGKLAVRIGMGGLDPDGDQTAQSLFEDAMPGASSAGKNAQSVTNGNGDSQDSASADMQAKEQGR